MRLTPAGSVLLRETGILLERWEEGMRRVRRTAAGESWLAGHWPEKGIQESPQNLSQPGLVQREL